MLAVRLGGLGRHLLERRLGLFLLDAQLGDPLSDELRLHALLERVQLQADPTVELLQPHYERLMSVVTARPRSYVVFCGAVFERLVGQHVMKEHRFRLTKGDGSPSQSEYRFANLELSYGEKSVRAGVAYSWAQQGIPMRQYGEAVRDRYRPA